VPALTVEAAHEHEFPDGPADILDGLVRDIAFVIQPGQMRFVRRLPASREADFPRRRDQLMTKPPQPGNTVVSSARLGRRPKFATRLNATAKGVIADAAQCDVNTALGAADPSTCAYRAATTEAGRAARAISASGRTAKNMAFSRRGRFSVH
jgi:hypothetical protein